MELKYSRFLVRTELNIMLQDKKPGQKTNGSEEC